MNEKILISFIIGFIAAAPLGPLRLLCLRKSLVHGISSGILSALGISVAFFLWSFIAVHGLASFSHWIQLEHQPIEIVIGLFLILYGLNTIFNSPKVEYPTLKRNNKFADFFSTFILMFLNPSTFVMFTALFTIFGIAKGQIGVGGSLAISFAVFLGTYLMWIMISYLLQHVRKKVDDTFIMKFSHFSSYFSVLFGVVVLFYSLK